MRDRVLTYLDSRHEFSIHLAPPSDLNWPGRLHILVIGGPVALDGTALVLRLIYCSHYLIVYSIFTCVPPALLSS